MLKNKKRKIIWASIFVLAFLSCVNTVIYCENTSFSNKQKISLDIKGMDVLDVLKMFSQQANINIIAGKNVSGRVTMFLKDVDIWDAFEIILLANDLAYERKGDIVNVMTSRDFEMVYGRKFADKRQLVLLPLRYGKATMFASVLSQVKSSIGVVLADESSNNLIIVDTEDKIEAIKQIIKKLDSPLDTRTFSLNYAKAGEVNTKLQESITKGIGSLKFDERTNKVIITDYPDKLDEIENVVDAFDEKNKQVLIDAQIVEITPERDEFKMGVDWDYWIKKNLRFASSLPMSTSATMAIGKAAAAGAVLNSDNESKSTIDALRTIGKTKILSSPRILALNNQEAKIVVGTKEVYITETVSQPSTGSTVTASQVNFVDVGVQLYVTPTINDNGYVTMKIKPIVSSAEYRQIKSADKTSEIPVVSTSEAETQVTLKDGVTVMIAGLKKDKKEKEVRKIPLLGDIPLLGLLLRSTKDSVTKTELVVFLTPHINSGDIPDDYESLTKDSDIIKIQNQQELNSTIYLDPAKKFKPERKILTENQYYKYVRSRIKDIFSLAITSQKGEINNIQGEVGVSFVIINNGQIKKGSLVIKSPNQQINNLVKQCLENKSFVPFPKALDKSEAGFSFTLAF